MRALWRSGPLLLALGVAWTGCNQSSDGPPRPAAQSVAEKPDQAKSQAQDKSLKHDQNADRKGADQTAAVIIPAGMECVLTVEGMA